MKIEFTELDGYIGLIVDGIVQSIYPPPPSGYYSALIPDKDPKTALILGVGGGTVCWLLKKKYPDIKITGVDNSREVITAAADKLKFNDLKLNLIIDDAFQFIKKETNKYGLIIVDIFKGPWITVDVLSEKFIEQCKKLLNKEGMLYINLPDLDALAASHIKGGTKTTIGGCAIYGLKN